MHKYVSEQRARWQICRQMYVMNLILWNKNKNIHNDILHQFFIIFHTEIYKIPKYGRDIDGILSIHCPTLYSPLR